MYGHERHIHGHVRLHKPLQALFLAQTGGLCRCRGGRVRLAWKGPGSSSESLLSAEEASSPLAADSIPVPELQHEQHLHFGHSVLVWGCTVLLAVSHSCDRVTGWVLSSLVVTNVRQPPGGAVRMGRRSFTTS